MNTAVKTDYDIRVSARHSYLQKAKQLSKLNDPRYEFFLNLAEREQLGIEKLENYYPLSQV